MGLFDIFDDANEQFKKDVSKAWDELWDNDSDDDDDNVQSSTSTDEILNCLENMEDQWLMDQEEQYRKSVIC